MVIKNGLFILLLSIGLHDVLAQKSWNIELFGGPSVAYTNTNVLPRSRHFSELNKLSYCGGMNILYAFSPHLGIGSEIGIASRAIGIKLVNVPVQNGIISKYVKYSTISSPTISVGPRFSFRKQNTGFYFYPSIGLLFNPDNLAIGQLQVDINQSLEQNTLIYEHINNIGFFANVDVGLRFYFKNDHYILLGMRHLHGFQDLESFSSEDYLLQGEEYDFHTSSRGSYSSGIIGFGFNLNNISWNERGGETKAHSPANELVKKTALSDGEYLMLYGGIRGRVSHQKNPENIFSNLNGQVGLVYGHRFKWFSIEGGIANTADNNYLQIDHPEKRAVAFLPNPYSVWSIPLTIKYDQDLGSNNNFRLGFLFSTQFIVENTAKRQFQEVFSGIYTSGDLAVTYEGTLTSNELNPGKVFLRAGVFSEVFVGKSLFVNLLISRNFASPVLSSISAAYSVNGQYFNESLKSTLNGTIVELGVRRPLSTLKLRKKYL